MEWLGNIGVGSMFITLGTMLLQILGGKHDDRDMRGSLVRLQLFGELQTIHHWHHHIADDQIRNFLLGYLQSFLAIHSLHYYIIILQKRMLILTDIIVVIDDQNGWLIGILANQLLYFSTFPHAIIDILQYRLVYHILII